MSGFTAQKQKRSRRLKQLGANGRALRFDVTKADDVERAFASVHAAHGRVDVLVNNAGVTRDAPLALLDAGDWRDVLSVKISLRGCVPVLEGGAGSDAVRAQGRRS